MNSDFSEGIRKYTSEKPDENPDPTRPEPGVNEPQKNDPTLIDVSLLIFKY